MSDTYQRQRQTTEKLLRKYGGPLRLVELEASGYDPLDPESSPSIKRECPCFGAVLPMSESALVAFDTTVKHDPEVADKRRMVYIAAKGLTFQPEEGMLLLSATVSLYINAITALDPAGSGAILHRVRASLNAPIGLEPVDAISINGDILTINGDTLTITL